MNRAQWRRHYQQARSVRRLEERFLDRPGKPWVLSISPSIWTQAFTASYRYPDGSAVTFDPLRFSLSTRAMWAKGNARARM